VDEPHNQSFLDHDGGRCYPVPKVIASLAMLATWETSNEHNSWVFHNKHVPSFDLFDKIKTEARLWVIAGAKRVGEICWESRL
jgi:hypothetical protein